MIRRCPCRVLRLNFLRHFISSKARLTGLSRKTEKPDKVESCEQLNARGSMHESHSLTRPRFAASFWCLSALRAIRAPAAQNSFMIHAILVDARSHPSFNPGRHFEQSSNKTTIKIKSMK